MRKRSLILAATVTVAVWAWWRCDRGEPAGEAGVERHGFEDMSPRTFHAPTPAPLGAPTAIAGRVRDPKGRAIAGARVCATVHRAGPARAGDWVPSCELSRADGGYRLTGLVPGRHAVAASARGYLPGQHGEAQGGSVTVRAAEQLGGIDLVLWPGGVELRGTVSDVSGGEIEGAIVSTGGSVDFSGPDGSFVLYVRPGRQGVTALAENYAAGGDWVTVPGQTAHFKLLPEAVLVGRVVRASDGLPVADATVKAERGAPQGTTDANGNFRIGQLRPGMFKPYVEADAYTGMAQDKVYVGIGETSTPVTIRVHPATSVRGKIVGPGGASCEEGTVSLSEPTTRRSASAGVEVDGEVTVRGLLPGMYAVKVQCAGYVPEDSYEAIVVGEAAIEGVRWPVRAGQAIRGRVVDARGAGAPAEAVLAHSQGASSGRGRASDAAVAADGSFHLRGMRPGAYALEVSFGPGRPPPPRVPVEVPEGRDVEGVEIRLAEGSEVRGKVIDGAGRPVARATVSLRGAQSGGSQETGDDGRFAVQGVLPGQYRATAYIDARPLKRAGEQLGDALGVSVEVRAGAATEVELVVETRDGRITGQVVDGSGEPVADAFLDWLREAEPGDSGSYVMAPQQPTLSDGEGRFELSGLPPGSYTITASRHDVPGQGTVEHVALGGTAVVTIPATGEIGGSVRIAGGGAPEWVKVTAREAQSRGWGDDEFFRTEGRFTLAGLGPGTYSLRAESSEGAAEATVTLAAGEVRRDIALVLAPRVTVRGRLVDVETGAPVVGMSVGVAPAQGGLAVGMGSRSVTDAQGSFEVVGATTGPAVVSVTPVNHDYQSGEYAIAGVPVLLEGTGTIELAPIAMARRRAPADRPAGDLGFSVAPAPREQAPAARRVIVALVRPEGPAGRAGLRVGDEIAAVDGHAVSGPGSHLFRQLTTVPSGRTLQLTLGRGETIAVTAETLR
ncbi:carboxypeptidase regulatory-like domain-containing protein [Nannocystis bainbridge]|uniref:Carboxypeptidase regulatory-like domain-containing protein n=1 Tax=Nannocystis bainbridge TaxID=2995303 RepID=A0ABT5DV30_9BACT|nr:carboxypeptidase regulatory-like domain-containing protein [Nannocystis bainbridge]MDC0717426.1 carboxypeptidase regulatory-like domain-containing protein [Nannocystis bainbridge]